MSNSKKSLIKIMLAVITFSSTALYCAEPAANPDQANASANAAGEYFKLLTAAEEAFDAIPENSSKPLTEELLDLKDSLQTFAQAYMIAQREAEASGKQDIIDALNTMANVDLVTKPVFQALKEEFRKNNYARLASDNLFLLQILADINNKNHWGHGLSILDVAKTHNQSDLIELLKVLGAQD